MEIHDLRSILTVDGIYADVSYHNAYIDATVHAKDDAHIHDYCEIYFNLRGNVSFSVENTIYPVQSGDMIVSMPHEVHYCIYHRDGEHEYYCLWVRASEAFQYLLTPFWERKRGQGNRIRLNDRDKERLAGWLRTLLAERERGHLTSVKSGSAILNILDLLNEVKDQTAAATHLPDVLRDILAFIEQNLRELTSVGELCDAFFISRSSMGRLFKQSLGTTPTKYIENKRLALAKRLLEGKCSVQETCERCGFADYSHFIALFRTRFGITPLQYQRRHR